MPLNKKMKPILFSTPMVQAILDGRKTQTRRIIKGTAKEWIETATNPDWMKTAYELSRIRNGDILWVRETFAEQHPAMTPGDDIPDWVNYIYKADNPEPDWRNGKWKPSIFMPREAARIFLEVTNVRAERLHDLDDNDAINEGIGAVKSGYEYHDIYQDYLNDKNSLNPIPSYKSLWEKINGKGSWDLNPWVWVYKFKVL